jgi:inositol-1,3,4-trisphosphate 5/6-kinase
VQVAHTADWEGIQQRMAAAGMSTPVIVKPSIACGVSEAHAMTLVLRPEGFGGISCTLPACVQEYIDHAAMLYKVYVMGSEVCCTFTAACYR